MLSKICYLTGFYMDYTETLYFNAESLENHSLCLIITFLTPLKKI